MQLLRQATRFESGEFVDRRPLSGKILSNIFLDLSRNHTRLSFNSAWVQLGGTLLNFERSIDELTSSRNAPDEIAELCNNYGDMAVLRTLDPHIQTEEFSKRINNSAHNGYFGQARGAVYVRMALFAAVMGAPCSQE